jgi:predicted Zn finger-like uncharacterized protein
MKIECPKCLAAYHIPEAKIPAASKKARCAKCGHRFMVVPPQTPSRAKSSAPGRPAIIHPSSKKKDIASEFLKKQTHSSPPLLPPVEDPWKESLYSRLFKHIRIDFRSKNKDQRYFFTAFTFAYREIPSGLFIKNEVSRLRTLIKSNETGIKLAQERSDWDEVRILQGENARYQGIITVFKDIVALRKQFLSEGLKVSFNMVYTVLKDVERFFESTKE